MYIIIIIIATIITIKNKNNHYYFYIIHRLLFVLSLLLLFLLLLLLLSLGKSPLPPDMARSVPPRFVTPASKHCRSVFHFSHLLDEGFGFRAWGTGFRV